MMKEMFTDVFQKPMEVNPLTKKPLLLFVTYGKDEEKGMNFIRINGIRNPLPFRIAYGISPFHLESWLKSNGWDKVGYRNIRK